MNIACARRTIVKVARSSPSRLVVFEFGEIAMDVLVLTSTKISSSATRFGGAATPTVFKIVFESLMVVLSSRAILAMGNMPLRRRSVLYKNTTPSALQK
ncbi:MAG: hypothetical protein KIT24_11590 [Phycisphaeraceae bacterium]|nr:hypothetical protein [Phycisphaeraceae bacterium]